MHWLGQSERESEGGGWFWLNLHKKHSARPASCDQISKFPRCNSQFSGHHLWITFSVCTGLHQIARIFQDLSPGEAFVKITDHCLQLCLIRHSLSGVCIEFQCIWSHGPVSNMHSVHSETEAHLWITSGMGSTFVGNIKCLNNLRSSKSFDVGAGDLVWIMWGSKH